MRSQRTLGPGSHDVGSALVILFAGIFVAGAGLSGCGPSAVPASNPILPMHLADSIQPDTACWTVIAAAQEDSALWPAASACVNVVDTRRRARGLEIAEPEMKYLGELMWRIPEYHDEQRLYAGPGRFGPKAFIYASPALPSFKSLAQFAEHGARGVVVAVVSVAKFHDQETFPDSYRALYLRWGLNCVWLSYQPELPPPDQWRAYVSQPQTGSVTCDPVTGPQWLPVKRTQVKTGGFFSDNRPIEDYPDVARFGETESGKPLLGVKCLAGWCDIGPDAATAKEPMSPPVSFFFPITAASREERIKGWHDEQILSDRVAPGYFVPAIRAKITPFPRIDTLKLKDFSGGWTRMARIQLETDPLPGTKYRRWGLRGGPEFRENIFELWLDGTDWKARLVTQPKSGAAPPPITWDFKERHLHYDAGVPGTARFRWTVADDGIWVPCGQGCCKAEGPQG